MRICYVATTVHLSRDLTEALGSTTHTYSIAKEFVRLGHKVHIICERYESDPDKETIDQIYIHRLRRGIITSSKRIKKSKLRRFARHFKIISNFILALKISRIVKKYDLDIVFERAHSRGVGALVSMLTNKPLFLEVIDCIFNRLSCKRASKIFAYTKEFFKPRIQKKVILVEAGYNPEFFYKKDIKIKYDLAYSGSFKEWDGLEDLVLACQKIISKENPDLKVLLIGDGVMFKKIEQMIKENNLDKNFKLIGRVSLKRITDWLCSARVCLAPFNISRSKKGEFARFGYYFSPLKIFEYLACGKPIVATDYPRIRQVISEKNGEFFSEGDIEDLAWKIIHLLKIRNLKEIEKNNLILARKYTWEKVVRKMEEEIKKSI